MNISFPPGPAGRPDPLLLLDLLGKDLPFTGDGHHRKRDDLAALRDGTLDSMVEPPAAGNLHPRDRDGANRVPGDDLGKLLAVVSVVKLRAADEGHPTLHERLVEGAVGEGGAVGGDEEVRVFKEAGVGGDELELHRPLTELT